MSEGSEPRTRSDEDILVGFVETALADMDRGATPDVNEICRDHPHLVGAVSRALGLEKVVPGPTTANPLKGRVLADRLVELKQANPLGVKFDVSKAEQLKNRPEYADLRSVRVVASLDEHPEETSTSAASIKDTRA